MQNLCYQALDQHPISDTIQIKFLILLLILDTISVWLRTVIVSVLFNIVHEIITGYTNVRYCIWYQIRHRYTISIYDVRYYVVSCAVYLRILAPETMSWKFQRDTILPVIFSWTDHTPTGCSHMCADGLEDHCQNYQRGSISISNMMWNMDTPLLPSSLIFHILF